MLLLLYSFDNCNWHKFCYSSRDHSHTKWSTPGQEFFCSCQRREAISRLRGKTGQNTYYSQETVVVLETSAFKSALLECSHKHINQHFKYFTCKEGLMAGKCSHVTRVVNAKSKQNYFVVSYKTKMYLWNLITQDKRKV